ncbi:ABC transporter permease [Futiania mangrovi]|uniref:ABC transporter permease n=1 Tax=Futiania mangrovi TaxID=2959716 RepID=A0A9J6PJ96_9PROT|nr:FtsX-like permease family protein [Futiania mangrovii]MCP1336623.1 ABC transporter permease [Futiania mangrovii]
MSDRTAEPGAATSWRLAARLARRDLRGGLKGVRIFVACLLLGVAAIAAVGSLAASIEAGLSKEGAALLGGDLAVRIVHVEATPEQQSYLEDLGTVSRMADMRAMAGRIAPDGTKERRTLVQLSAVDGAYPLYGTPRFDPALPVDAALAKTGGAWGAVVEGSLARRLGLAPGDTLRIGTLDYEVRAEILTTPDRGSAGLTWGPRVMVAFDSLAETGLIQPGSLVNYHYRVALSRGADVEQARAALQAQFPDAGWQVRDRRNGTPQVREFVERVAMFLTLVGLTALVVGGVGVANGVKDYLDGKIGTIATLKCIGATDGLIVRMFMLEVLAFAGAGILGGLVLGAVIPPVGLALLADLLPVPAVAGLYPVPLAVAGASGLLVALAFAVWPLAATRDVRPARLFRALVAATGRRVRWSDAALGFGALIVLAALTLATARDTLLVIWFGVGLVAAFALLRLTGWLAVRLARALQALRPGAVVRLALANLNRPGSPAPSVVLSLGLGLTVLVTVSLVDGNLARQVQEDLPENAPAYFFIDIQGPQSDAFAEAVSAIPGVRAVDRSPMLRGRFVAINGVPASEATVAPGGEWMLRGDRGLTYAARPPEGTTIVAGKWWPEDYDGPPLVSFEAEGAMELGIGIGDTITVNVLGREITAEIASLRELDWRTLGINFLMIFTPNTLAGAPQTVLATAEMTPAAEAAVERAVAQDFPNVSAIRVRDALETVATYVENLGAAVRGISAVTILSGLLVLAGALAAGQRARTYDAVVLKVLGATRGRLAAVHLTEFALLGLATAVVSAALGTVGAWAVVDLVMGARFTVLPWTLLATVAGTLVVTVGIGIALSWRTLSARPAGPLRQGAG